MLSILGLIVKLFSFHPGTDEKTLISILTERSNAQRQLIVKEYQAAYGKVHFDELNRQ